MRRACQAMKIALACRREVRAASPSGSIYLLCNGCAMRTMSSELIAMPQGLDCSVYHAYLSTRIFPIHIFMLIMSVWCADGMSTDTAPQRSIPFLDGEIEPVGDSDYKQPGSDFLSDDDSQASDDSRPGHGRQAFAGPSFLSCRSLLVTCGSVKPASICSHIAPCV